MSYSGQSNLSNLAWQQRQLLWVWVVVSSVFSSSVLYISIVSNLSSIGNTTLVLCKEYDIYIMRGICSQIKVWIPPRQPNPEPQTIHSVTLLPTSEKLPTFHQGNATAETLPTFRK